MANTKLKIQRKKASPKKSVKTSAVKSTKVKLIDGVFIPEEAKDILLSMYRSKIQFHEMRNFSHKERFGAEDKTSVKRIPLLKKSMEKISKLIQKAEAKGERLEIKTDVSISFKKIKSKK